jgi:hypothetical protein
MRGLVKAETCCRQSVGKASAKRMATVCVSSWQPPDMVERVTNMNGELTGHCVAAADARLGVRHAGREIPNDAKNRGIFSAGEAK